MCVRSLGRGGEQLRPWRPHTPLSAEQRGGTTHLRMASIQTTCLRWCKAAPGHPRAAVMAADETIDAEQKYTAFPGLQEFESSSWHLGASTRSTLPAGPGPERTNLYPSLRWRLKVNEGS